MEQERSTVDDLRAELDAIRTLLLIIRHEALLDPRQQDKLIDFLRQLAPVYRPRYNDLLSTSLYRETLEKFANDLEKLREAGDE